MAFDKENFGRLVCILRMHGTNDTTDAAIVADAIKIQRLARGIRWSAVNSCNRPRTPREIKREAAQCKAVEALAASYGLRIVYGDDRGDVVHLTGPNVRGNTLGGDEQGFGVAS
jgi:hypothetical protein